jgi:hypothetical protein
MASNGKTEILEFGFNSARVSASDFSPFVSDPCFFVLSPDEGAMWLAVFHKPNVRSILHCTLHDKIPS